MGLSGEKLKEAVSEGAGSLLQTKKRTLFRDRALQRELFAEQRIPLEVGELKSLYEQVSKEAQDLSNFEAQAKRVSITKHHSEKNISAALEQIAGLIGTELVFPKNISQLDKEWDELAEQLHVLQENAHPFTLSVKIFMTLYQHQTAMIQHEIKLAGNIAAEMKAKAEEIEFLEQQLLGTLRDLYRDVVQIEGFAENNIESVSNIDLSGYAKKHILYGQALSRFDLTFRRMVETERDATKRIHHVLKKNKGRLKRFEQAAEAVSKVAKDNREFAAANFFDKVFSYFTIGNVLTVLAFTGVVLTSFGFSAGILGVMARVLFGTKFSYFVTFFNPAVKALGVVQPTEVPREGSV